MGRHHHHVDRPPLSEVGELVGRMAAVQRRRSRRRRVLGEVLQVGGRHRRAAHARVPGRRAERRPGPATAARRTLPTTPRRQGIACSENGEPSTHGHDPAVLTPWPSLELRADDKYGRGDLRSTSSVMLPSNAAPNPPRPWLAMRRQRRRPPPRRESSRRRTCDGRAAPGTSTMTSTTRSRRKVVMSSLRSSVEGRLVRARSR